MAKVLTDSLGKSRHVQRVPKRRPRCVSKPRGRKPSLRGGNYSR